MHEDKNIKRLINQEWKEETVDSLQANISEQQHANFCAVQYRTTFCEFRAYQPISVILFVKLRTFPL